MDISLTDQINDNTLNKYKSAGLIATKAITEIVKCATVGALLKELEENGMKFITTECQKIYKDVQNKGLAFPLCLSLNNVAGHQTTFDQTTLQEGDLLKIEVGVQIDGFPAMICYTTLVTDSKKYADKRGKVLKATIEASREISTVMKPGKTNKDVVGIMEKWAAKYNCNLPICNNDENEIVPGVVMYQVSQNVCDGYNDDDAEMVHQCILTRDNPYYGYTMDEMPFEENEVYVIDVVMSTGTGKLHKMDDVNIYRRDHFVRQNLSLKTARETLNLFKKAFPKVIPKTARVKMGLVECIRKNLLKSYPIVQEDENEFIARIKYTIIVRDRPILICGKSADKELEKIE
jgi:methionine aminopeptidase